jgi:hypothetical protein
MKRHHQRQMLPVDLPLPSQFVLLDLAEKNQPTDIHCDSYFYFLLQVTKATLETAVGVQKNRQMTVWQVSIEIMDTVACLKLSVYWRNGVKPLEVEVSS